MAVRAEYKDEVLKVEPKGIEPVRDEERHGRPSSLFTLWWGANVEFATLAVGALPIVVFGLGFGQAVVALVLANVLGAVLLALLSLYGPRLGVPQLIQSRKAFGYYGNYLPGILNFVAGFAWFAVNTVLGVEALQYLIGLTFATALILMLVVQVLIAILGYNMIHSFERYMSILLTIVFLIVSYYAVTKANVAIGFNPKVAGAAGPSGAFILTFSVAFSYLLGWMAFSSDYSRYLPKSTKPRTIFHNVFWSALVSCAWLELVGLLLSTVKPIFAPTDLVTGLVPHAIAVITMLAVIVGTVTANVLNIYSGALSALVVNIPIKRWQSAIVVGVLGALVAWTAGQGNFLTNYTFFLYLLGYWVAPWVAIVLVDFFLVQKGEYHTAVFYDKSRGVMPGFWFWIGSVAVSVLFMNQYLSPQLNFIGPIANALPQLGDITYYVSFLLAGTGYLLYSRSRSGAKAASQVAETAGK